METFCHDFGMLTVSKTDNLLCMRGYGEDSAVHITEKALEHEYNNEDGFVGLGFDAASEEAFERYASINGLPIEDYTGPGGGSVIHIQSPEGCKIELLWGGQKAEPVLGVLPEIPCNYASGRSSNYVGNKRTGYVKRTNAVTQEGNFQQFATTDTAANGKAANTAGPSHVVRLGHVVMNCKNFRDSEKWWKQHFGLITSDEIRIKEDKVLGAFMRCDRGDVFTDHHAIFMIGTGKGFAFNHAAFEVADMDDLMAGNSYLKNNTDYHHSWGVGRHIEGSQIFDYWHDPFGHQVEHWTDGDQLNRASGSNVGDVSSLMGSQWGPTDGRGGKMEPFPKRLPADGGKSKL
jgi:catechol 2,3-dioxygenase-like lactoylglutathione lyase family enzyme